MGDERRRSDNESFVEAPNVQAYFGLSEESDKIRQVRSLLGLSEKKLLVLGKLRRLSKLGAARLILAPNYLLRKIVDSSFGREFPLFIYFENKALGFSRLAAST